jgi:hypothetical protein
MLIMDRDRNSNLLYIYMTDLDLVRLAGTSLGPQIESRSALLHKHADGCRTGCQNLSALTGTRESSYAAWLDLIYSSF